MCLTKLNAQCSMAIRDFYSVFVQLFIVAANKGPESSLCCEKSQVTIGCEQDFATYFWFSAKITFVTVSKTNNNVINNNSFEYSSTSSEYFL